VSRSGGALYDPSVARSSRLTHVDARGAARMVDVSKKAETARRARAEGEVRLSPAALLLVRRNALAKGDVCATARLAGIQAAKRTADLIPLCHPLRLDDVDVRVGPEGRDRVRIRATVSARDRTGVEMEALTAVSVAALVVYDMVKAVDKGAEILHVRLVEKDGGRSGPWRRRGRRSA
jgi:cyclic pyranopterin phosphate synthase